MKAVLVLENGDSFDGISIGAPGERTGEVVLNTAVVGYQEMMTDPANAGKMLVLTYPLIGNYGVADKFNESAGCWISGLVIKEGSRTCSNWQAEEPFSDFLKKRGVVALGGVDTRTLAVTIRERGEMMGIISTRPSSKAELLKRLKARKTRRCNFIKDISVAKPTDIEATQSERNIGVLDLGMLNSFIKQLKTLGCNITLLPYDTPAETILSMKLDGLVISGGPEEDIAIPEVAKTVKKLIGRIPMMGISTGHEAIALALGARLKKMKAGHHGVNYPVKPPDSYKGAITVQNHSLVVNDNSLKTRNVKVTLRNLNDGSIEEMESASLKFISAQYYPASPGFDEVNPAFVRFLSMISPAKSQWRRRTPAAAREARHA